MKEHTVFIFRFEVSLVRIHSCHIAGCKKDGWIHRQSSAIFVVFSFFLSLLQFMFIVPIGPDGLHLLFPSVDLCGHLLCNLSICPDCIPTMLISTLMMKACSETSVSAYNITRFLSWAILKYCHMSD